MCFGYLHTTGSPLIHERFAALVLYNVLHAFTEGVGLALPGGVEAGVRRLDGVGAADQTKSNCEGGNVRAHDVCGCFVSGKLTE